MYNTNIRVIGIINIAFKAKPLEEDIGLICIR